MLLRKADPVLSGLLGLLCKSENSYSGRLIKQLYIPFSSDIQVIWKLPDQDGMDLSRDS